MRSSSALQPDARVAASAGLDVQRMQDVPHPNDWYATETGPPPPRVSVPMAFAAGFVSSIAIAGLAWLAISYWPRLTQPGPDTQTVARATKIIPLTVEERQAQRALPPVPAPAATLQVEPEPRQASKETETVNPTLRTGDLRVAPSVVDRLPSSAAAEQAADNASQPMARAPDPPSAAPSAFEEETASAAARARSAASSQPPAAPEMMQAPPPPVSYKRRVAKEAKPSVPLVSAAPLQGPQPKQAPAAPPAAPILGAETPFSYVWQQQPLSMPPVGRN